MAIKSNFSKKKGAETNQRSVALSSKKKGAMEMSVGTIVTIVLLMAVLVLGLVMVRTIFRSSTDNIDVIDQKVKDQINKMFSEDELRKIVIYPSDYVQLKKGKSAGFGLSIRNVDDTEGVFSYTIAAQDSSCGMSNSAADALISLGKTGQSISISAGNVMESPIYVRFDIPEDAPPCQIRYNLNVKKGSSSYGNTVPVDVEILSK